MQELTTMQQLTAFINDLSGIVWGPFVLMPLLLGTGIYLLFGMRCLQLRQLGPAFKNMYKSITHKGEEGEISPFEALMTGLAGTIGTGNIVGVATAIAIGGPGAIFWMWITGFLGMGIKYCEATLAVKYREVSPDGSYVGGPMYYIKNGLGRKWLPLAIFFAIAGAIASFGIGNLTQANAIATNLVSAFNIELIEYGEARIPGAWIIAILLFVFASIVIVGGVKRIGRVAGLVVPVMALIYILLGIYALVINFDKVPGLFALIFTSAFGIGSAAGGLTGAAIKRTIQMGMARGMFSNEAGLGSSPIAHAATTETNPVKQGLLGMIDPFLDTLVVCTVTALIILISGEWQGDGANLSAGTLTARSFHYLFPLFGQHVVAFALMFFAFTTFMAWSVYGDRCIRFLFGDKWSMPYRMVFCLAVPIGAVSELDFAWAFADLANGLMAIPNLIALLFLSPVVFKLTKEFLAEQEKEKRLQSSK